MFAFLQESHKQYYDPTAFAFAYKDFEGKPTNTSLQMDVDEFFNMLCEKLENQLKGTVQEKLLQNIWSGKLTSQLICKGCVHRSEKDDTFYTISLDIQGKVSRLNRWSVRIFQVWKNLMKKSIKIEKHKKTSKNLTFESYYEIFKQKFIQILSSNN
jgi:hypothetical protein